jgi:hypothetical protein
MFEVGSKYALKFGSNGEYNFEHGVVLEYQHPLVKIKTEHQELVLNVASPDFVSASKF